MFSIKKKNPSKKVVIVEEQLDDIDIDYTGNLEDLPSLVFINEACWNLKIVDYSVESLK